MKVHTEYLKFHTKNHREYIHITPQVESIVSEAGWKKAWYWFRPCTSRLEFT